MSVVIATIRLRRVNETILIGLVYVSTARNVGSTLFTNRRVNELWEEELEESKQKLIEGLRAVEQLHLEVA
jgi:hypothetical protein